MHFGKLYVCGLTEQQKDKNGKYLWDCLCDCGNRVSVTTTELKKSRYPKRSCGCDRYVRTCASRKNTCDKKYDLTGKTFGCFYVEGEDNNVQRGNGKHKYWLCRCNLCGVQYSLRSSDLRGGGKTECRCTLSQRMSESCTDDLTGMTFGHLTILGRDRSAPPCAGQHARWLCKCDLCGRVESNSSSMLLQYGKDRCLTCGGSSIGEKKVGELLLENGITYVREATFDTCRNDGRTNGKRGKLRFDFEIIPGGDDQRYFIEYDGEQHFKEVPLWDEYDSFDGRIQRDRIKDSWCAANGMPLIRIPYHRLKDLCIDDLRLDTSAYRVC